MSDKSWKRYIFILSFLLCSCTTPQPQVYHYDKLKLTLVCADPNTLDYNCRGGKHGGMIHDDRGNIYPRAIVSSWPDNNGMMHHATVKIPACWVPALREIWMRWGEFCDTLSHEFCHANGQDPRECADKYPRRNP